jgi:hypothetical protein
VKAAIVTHVGVQRGVRYVRERGYVGLQREEFQRLIRVTKLYGVTVRTEVLDEEIIPEYALAALGATGCSDWVSKFAKYIPAR